MTGHSSDDLSLKHYTMKLRLPTTAYCSSSLTSLGLSKYCDDIKDTTGIHKSRSFSSTTDKTEYLSNRTNNESNAYKEKFAKWVQNCHQKSWLTPKVSQSSIEIKELQKLDEEEEEIETILNSTSPSLTSNHYYENTRAETNPYEEELYRWKLSQACQCNLCVKQYMDDLPKPPKNTLEIGKSQSLNNVYHLYKQTLPQNGLQKMIQGCEPSIIHTQEKDTNSYVTFNSDILNFQGTIHSKEDVAPIWKKDCRMWLWKTVEAKRKRRLKINMKIQDDELKYSKCQEAQ